MGNGEGIMTMFLLGFLGFVGFVIYFIFKIMQFVLTATNLYKKMINRQDSMIRLLLDIRDNTKAYTFSEDAVSETVISEESASSNCPHCSAPVSRFDAVKKICSQCGKPISA